ncbi:hypothetical protein [uncultured Duncaniella sp.]|uniref:hypothetical protein n=1 Tax=uncultured Duncaniella sp. TaxID=2768039 RepID=UPI0025A971DA|nr:hypothetical protein [uncultured Duncaniella sp.]
METKATTSSIEVTRNVSTNNEMRLMVGALTVTANVESSGGEVRSVTDGTVTDTGSGTHRASFRFYRQGPFNVDFHSAVTREDRTMVHGAVEDFIEAASAKVSADTQPIGNSNN